MTTKTIVFSSKALEDIAEIVEHIAVYSPNAAKAFRERLEQTCSLLADMPSMGIARNFGHPSLAGVRFFPLKHFDKYLVFYRVPDDALHVIRIVHGARDLPGLFGAASSEE